MDHTGPLPPETLSEIFYWLYLMFLGPSTVYPLVNSQSVRDFCWPVSSVCKFWREVALASPFLWAHLPCLNVDYLSEERLKEQLAILDVLLSRSRNHPLHVSVFSPNVIADLTDTAYDLIPHALHDLTRHSERWQSLSISAASDIIELSFENIRKRLPRLEALTLDFQLDPESSDVSTFADAPQLKFVHVTGPLLYCPLSLDTTSLTRLHDDIAAILHNIVPSYHGFPLLTTLELCDADTRWDAYIPENLVFPVLKTLDYCHERTNINDGFMGFAIIPVLEEMSIKTIYQENVIQVLLEMCHRNGGLPLKNLRLRVMEEGCDMNGFRDLLRLLPTLEILDTHLPSIADISLLSVLEGPEVLVPHLRKCSFLWDAIKMDGSMHQALVQLASARCSPLLTAPEEERLTVVQLSFQAEVNGPRSGREPQRYYFVALQPTKLEPWYDDKYEHQERNPRKVYIEAQAILPATIPFRSSGKIDPNWNGYHHALESLEKSYNATQINQFLETNTNIWMIALAHTFKECFPVDDQGRNPAYERVVRLMNTVKEDLMKRLDDFHWTWETTPGAYSIRYIPDQHEMRADRDEFANAILGLSGDESFLDDF